MALKKAEKANEEAMVGNSDGAPVLTLGTEDIYAVYEGLKERACASSASLTATRGA